MATKEEIVNGFIKAVIEGNEGAAEIIKNRKGSRFRPLC